MAFYVWSLVAVVLAVLPTAYCLANCPEGYEYRGNLCLKFIDGQVTFEEATAACKAAGGILPEPRSEEEYGFLGRFGVEKKVGTAWIGATDSENEGIWIWQSDGLELTYAKWPSPFFAPLDNGAGYDCAYFRPANEAVTHLLCDRKLTDTICQAEPLSSAKICPTGYELYGSLCYHSFDQAVDYDEARENCKSLGGNVAEPRSAEEYTQLLGFAVSYRYSTLWVGATDREQEGHWQWDSDKSKMDYAVWNTNEPNDSGSGEDCVQLRVAAKNLNDLRCITKLRHVCQAEPLKNKAELCHRGYKMRNSGCYQYYPAAFNWNDARGMCERAGGFLAEPKTEDEGRTLVQIGMEYKDNILWFGATDLETEGAWKWHSDNTALNSTYTAWRTASKEPNNAGAGENCAMLYIATKDWYDRVCLTKASFVCQLGEGGYVSRTKPSTSTKDRPRPGRKDKPSKKDKAEDDEECQDSKGQCKKWLKKDPQACKKGKIKRKCKKTCGLC